MKRLLSVNEFAKLSGIERTTLRYWDEIGLFSPTVRGPENKYRGYTSDQLSAAHFIVILSKLDIPLKTINNAKNDKTPYRIIQLLEEQERKLDIELLRLQESYSIIHERLSMIRYGVGITSNHIPHDESSVPDVTVRHMPEGKFILGPSACILEEDTFHDAFIDFRKQAEYMRINLSYPIGSYYNSIDNFLENPGAPNNFFSSDPHGNSKWSSGDYLTGYARGTYGDFEDVPAKMTAYATEYDLVLSGPVYQIYLLDELCQSDPSRYLAQFSVSCTKRLT